ncbi:MAG: class I SAM-dependent methyltransferase [Actinomycetota bacterium]|nr:class I SAM-dependent methyltransferase [Actinomycetota bacterium]
MSLFPPCSRRSAINTRFPWQRLLGWEPAEFRRIETSALGGIEGWRYRQDLVLLYLLARDLPGEGVTLEIGSYKGLATTALAYGVLHGSHEEVHTVDPHTGDRQELEATGATALPSEEAFKRNIRAAGVENVVVSYTATSDELAREWNGIPIRLLFVDGWHSYDAVTSDLRNWVPLLTGQGAVLIDDYYNYPDVRAAIDNASDLLPPREIRAGRMRLAFHEPLPSAGMRYLRIPWG